MSTHVVISDAALEAMLDRRANRADPGSLHDEVFALIDATGRLMFPKAIPTERPNFECRRPCTCSQARVRQGIGAPLTAFNVCDEIVSGFG